ncbi:ExeM/NucH family extracellular endonuclease [Salipiger thiooxidans]|uniref:ExeM/NucH family extracellular endonuclease n=1 Tax=Salipiger thiooxidans TaxID=282683 RepID=UPI0021E5375F|nr:ExeM/NucH family extracellular endonuclease [Salipiger thiooxidans]
MAFSIFFGAAGSAWLGTRRADSLVGTDGRDLLLGLAGNDTLNGGDGWDMLIGGAGKDVAEYAGGIDDYDIGQGFFGLGPVTVTALGGAPETGTDTLIGVEALYFAADGYTLHLDGTNNAALAGDDSAGTTENALLQIAAADLLANDREFDGDTLTIVSVAGLSTGGATVGFDGSTVTYDPGSAFDYLAAGETAQDSFTYVVDDGKGGTDVSTVTVTVTGENDAPVLVAPETVSVDEGALAFDAGISASDVDGDALSYALSGADAAQFTIDAATGALAFAGAPDFELPRDADGDNSYEITVTVSDGNGGSDSADLDVIVADVDEGLLRISESFETESVGAQYVSAGADGTITVLGEEVDLVNNAGQATVDSTTLAGLGYDLSWVNTRGDTGISDGDYIGVQDFTGTVGAYTDGAQGYELQDADGLLRLTFQTVNLSNTGAVRVSLDAFLQETGWEADDLVRVVIETDQGTVTLLDSTGQDIDDLGIEGYWQTLETVLDASVTEATLIVELDSNASSESLFLDNIQISELFSLRQSFETEAVGAQYVSAEADGAITALGEEVDLVNVAGLASIDSTAASDGLLGYDLSWVNTRGDTGISDGDYIGVQDFTGTVGAYTDGTQGYELQDADGLLRMTFDAVDLTEVGEVTVALDIFLQETGWESDDLVNIYVETDQGTVALLDSTGQDIDDLGIEGAWMTLETCLGADIDSARLVVELDSNASSESLFIDNVGIFEPVETGDDTTPAEVTLISAVQGSGDASTMEGDEVTVEAVVTYVTSTGFFLQEEDADADGDAATSEGLFIYTGSAPTVAVGDLVQATGTVAEYQGLTEVTAVSEVTVLGSGMTAPTAASILLTPDAAPDYEAVEGMSVSVTTGTSEALTITENYNLDRYGQIRVSAGTQTQPTQLYDAQTEAAEVAALAEANANASLLIDDGSSAQNPDSFEFLPGGAGDNGNGYLDAGDDFSLSTIRLGAEITSTVEGVLTYSFDEWTVNASGTVTIDESTNSGARQDTPDDVGGTLQVASYNVLNFFTTLDDGSLTGPDGDLDPRGADTAAEFERQADKLVGGILGSGAEVLALQEIENNGSGDGSAIDTLTDLINAGDPGANFGYVDPTGSGGFIGTDAITTGIIYDADAVTLLYSDFIAYEESSAAVTNALATAIADAIGYDFEAYDQSNRPSVAATFQDNASGETFTVVSSHFKSKGDSGLAALASAAEDHLAGGGTAITQADLDALYADANFDQGDGQGFWNGVRTDAAVELAEWIGTEYNGGGVGNVVMLGDMNSYAEEDPVQYLDDDAGFTDLIDAYIGQDEAYSYVFDGQQGTLDQGFADDMLAGFVTGVTEWHINADEPDLLSYDESFVDSAFYDAGVFGSSDHDPLIVGLDFGLGLS